MLRVAFVGKGGSGKSVIAGTLARLLAARGEPVLALDSDPMPGLAYSLGVDRSDAGLPDDLVVESEGGGPPFRLRDGLSPVEAIERYAVHGSDRLRFLQFGKVGGSAGDLRRSQFAFRQVTGGLGKGRWHVVGDLPAGTRQAFFGWGDYAETVLVVTEPTAAARVSARRLARLERAKDPPRLLLVANKTDGAEDAERLAAAVDLQLAGAVPRDATVRACERLGRPLVDHDADAPAVSAIRCLLDRLLEGT